AVINSTLNSSAANEQQQQQHFLMQPTGGSVVNIEIVADGDCDQPQTIQFVNGNQIQFATTATSGQIIDESTADGTAQANIVNLTPAIDSNDGMISTDDRCLIVILPATIDDHNYQA